jgi:hypothetical protein
MKGRCTHAEKALKAMHVRTLSKPDRRADDNGLYLVVDPSVAAMTP